MTQETVSATPIAGIFGATVEVSAYRERRHAATFVVEIEDGGDLVNVHMTQAQFDGLLAACLRVRAWAECGRVVVVPIGVGPTP